ncbi:ATP synthase protein I [Novimethylophilus kurashikiensis]|uniref:ATP synthase protein I n=1 Tax=Novimethylophilus kurashikiensis TaxID=1825523 RepID=A0A2R5F627_9PROT|nr:ATP synthase subunit I [Novimethylophilus kurashikiensis]GBG13760.1 ATP synthase protein I [Novimethylophilus kurashikiensis]
MDNVTSIATAFDKALRRQLIVTLVLSILAYFAAGMNAATSVLGGAAAAILGGYAGMKVAEGGKASTPGGALMVLLKAEAVKLGVIAVLLFAVFKFYKGLVPLALIGGLACAALISGAALRTLDADKNS